MSCFVEFIKRVGEMENVRLAKFDIFNNTGAGMLDSINHMTLKLF